MVFSETSDWTKPPITLAFYVMSWSRSWWCHQIEGLTVLEFDHLQNSPPPKKKKSENSWWSRWKSAMQMIDCLHSSWIIHITLSIHLSRLNDITVHVWLFRGWNWEIQTQMTFKGDKGSLAALHHGHPWQNLDTETNWKEKPSPCDN